MTKILISAGEASGDMYAGVVTKALKDIDKNIEVFGMGGDGLKAAGGEVLFDYKATSVMGFEAVIRNFPTIARRMKDFVKVMEDRKPDCLVCVDFPGFNMVLSELARERGIPVLYFIPPSAWAWKRSRAKKIAAITDKVACVLPNEYSVYVEDGADAEFVGHPLVDLTNPTMTKVEAEAFAGKREGQKLVVIIPGSRDKEIKHMLPVLLEAAKILSKEIPDLCFAMPKAKSISKAVLEDSICKIGLDVKLIEGNNYDLFSVGDIALAKSGTVTMEAALCGLGSVIVYKMDPMFYFLAKCFVKIKDIGLPNIVAGKRVFPELLQDDCNPRKIADEAEKMLSETGQVQIAKDVALIKENLGGGGAAQRVARLAIKVASGPKPKVTSTSFKLKVVHLLLKIF